MVGNEIKLACAVKQTMDKNGRNYFLIGFLPYLRNRKQVLLVFLQVLIYVAIT